MASTHAKGGTEGAFDSGVTVTRRRDRPSAHDEDSADVAPRSEPAASDDEGDATAPAATKASNTISTTPGPRKIRPMLLSDCPVTPNSAAAAANCCHHLLLSPLLSPTRPIWPLPNRTSNNELFGDCAPPLHSRFESHTRTSRRVQSHRRHVSWAAWHSLWSASAAKDCATSPGPTFYKYGLPQNRNLHHRRTLENWAMVRVS